MFEYGMRLRSFGIGCQPENHISYQDSDKSKTGYHGFLLYNRELTEKELYSFELDFLGKV